MAAGRTGRNRPCSSHSRKGDQTVEKLRHIYESDDGKRFKTKAAFQAYRREYFRGKVQDLMWMILDPPEAQDPTFAKLLPEEYDELHDTWIKSDPVNKALAKDLLKLLDLIENGCPLGAGSGRGRR